jgi:hypothetical protein
LAAAEIVLYYASGLAAIGLLGWWVVGDLLSTMQAAGGEAATGIPQMPQSLGPLQLGFFVSAAIWFHFREKALSWDWTLALGTGVVALASLVLCLAYAVSVFLGLTRADAFRAHLVVLSIVYFISSVVWLRQWEKRSGRLEKNL